MVINFWGHSFINKIKLYFKIVILATILFYILPNLLGLLWYINTPDPKIREEQLLERPLRVEIDIINTS
jgi:hypothetical protein